MTTVTGTASLNAFIAGDRWRHHRTRDHFGAESDLNVVLSADVGPWPEGTPVHHVLASLVGRVLSLEGNTPTVRSLVVDAWITPWFTADALIAGSPASSFTLDAWRCGGGSLTMDAYIVGSGSFLLQAFFIL